MGIDLGSGRSVAYALFETFAGDVPAHLLTVSGSLRTQLRVSPWVSLSAMLKCEGRAVPEETDSFLRCGEWECEASMVMGGAATFDGNTRYCGLCELKREWCMRDGVVHCLTVRLLCWSQVGMSESGY